MPQHLDTGVRVLACHGIVRACSASVLPITNALGQRWGLQGICASCTCKAHDCMCLLGRPAALSAATPTCALLPKVWSPARLDSWCMHHTRPDMPCAALQTSRRRSTSRPPSWQVPCSGTCTTPSTRSRRRCSSPMTAMRLPRTSSRCSQLPAASPGCAMWVFTTAPGANSPCCPCDTHLQTACMASLIHCRAAAEGPVVLQLSAGRMARSQLHGQAQLDNSLNLPALSVLSRR